MEKKGWAERIGVGETGPQMGRLACGVTERVWKRGNAELIL